DLVWVFFDPAQHSVAAFTPPLPHLEREGQSEEKQSYCNAHAKPRPVGCIHLYGTVRHKVVEGGTNGHSGRCEHRLIQENQTLSCPGGYHQCKNQHRPAYDHLLGIDDHAHDGGQCYQSEETREMCNSESTFAGELWISFGAGFQPLTHVIKHRSQRDDRVKAGIQEKPKLRTAGDFRGIEIYKKDPCETYAHCRITLQP